MMPVGDENVRGEELGAVDVHIVSCVEDGDVLALLGEEFGAICQARGVNELVFKDMVIEDRAVLRLSWLR